MKMVRKNIITSDDILGKEVVDDQGEILGVIQMLHIDKNSKTIVGITVDQGFMKPDLFIGLEHIQQFGVDTIFLNTFPRDKIKGMDVITAQGKNIGSVTGIEYFASNKIKSIIVKGGMGTKPTTIPVSKIKEIGYNVLLKADKNMDNESEDS